MKSLDWFIFQKINSLIGHFFELDILGGFLAEYLIYCLFLLAFLFYFFLWQQKKKVPYQEILILVFILGLSFLIYFLIRLFYHRPRPFVIYPEVFHLGWFLSKPDSPSLPSGHTILAFSLAFAILLVNRKIGWLFLVLAFLIGLARVFVGLHWPLDVLVSILITFIISRLANYLFKS